MHPSGQFHLFELPRTLLSKRATKVKIVESLRAPLNKCLKLLAEAASLESLDMRKVAVSWGYPLPFDLMLNLTTLKMMVLPRGAASNLPPSLTALTVTNNAHTIHEIGNQCPRLTHLHLNSTHLRMKDVGWIHKELPNLRSLKCISNASQP